jgi:hypothetical protein
MTTQFWSGFGVAVLTLAAVSTYAYWGSTVVEPREEEPVVVMDTATQAFTAELRAKFVAEKGQPIEGFEPWMFLEVYPGLVAEDFDGVDALIGLYRVENGQVVYDLNGEPELHSAARAISDEGMSRLLHNIAARLEVDLATDLADDDASASLAIIMAALEEGEPAPQQEAPAPEGPEQVSITGTIVCLPKKGPGPHTMECAYGLRADTGAHYGLRNLFTGPWPWPLDTGDRARITGVVVPPEPNTSYDIVGVIEVSNSQEL